MKKLLIFSLIILTSCFASKATRLLKHNDIDQKEFYGKLHFETKTGSPVVKIKVNGIEAKFLFDTGASSNVISPELAAKLNLKTLSTGYTTDSGGKRVILEYVAIDSIAIDSINFLNTRAVVADLTSSEAAACFELDGIIGTNLMRSAFWKIDYSEKSICFSNDLSKLKMSDGWCTLDFKLTGVAVPKIDLELNNKKITNVIFDTGYDGYISVSKTELSKLKANDQSIKTAFKTGVGGIGLFGLHESDTTFYAKINKVGIGDLELNNQIIEFRSHSHLIGSKFLLNYTVVMDWVGNHIYLKETSKGSFDSMENFGFNIAIRYNKLIITSLFGESDAWKKLKIGDQVLEMNGENYQGLSKSVLCDLYMLGSVDFDNQNHLKLKIKRGDEVVEISLQKEMLLE